VEVTLVKLVVVAACLFAAYHFMGKSVGAAAAYGAVTFRDKDNPHAGKVAARAVVFGIITAAWGFFAGYVAAGGVQ
jgi:hypothetical protein